jgi:hypothetical protein
VLEPTALLDAEVSMTEIILQALEARIVGLKKVVWLRWLLVAGWVRGCAGALDSTVSTVASFLWAGSRGVPAPAGPSLYPIPSL